jgi:hypothetical protein
MSRPCTISPPFVAYLQVVRVPSPVHREQPESMLGGRRLFRIAERPFDAAGGDRPSVHSGPWSIRRRSYFPAGSPPPGRRHAGDEHEFAVLNLNRNTVRKR